MGRMKQLWERVRPGRKPENPHIIEGFTGYKPGSDGARILEALCKGRLIGGHEAVKLTGSHNGLRRLNEVRRKLRQAGIPYIRREMETAGGRVAQKTQLHPRQWDRAWKLMRG